MMIMPVFTQFTTWPPDDERAEHSRRRHRPEGLMLADGKQRFGERVGGLPHAKEKPPEDLMLALNGSKKKAAGFSLRSG
jgi:hypothetical protein